MIFTIHTLLWAALLLPNLHAGIFRDSNETPSASNSSQLEKPFLRTQSIIEHKSELGRLLLLVCRKNCPRLRSQIPQWLRDYNEQRGFTAPQYVHYHYHTLRRPLPILQTDHSLPAIVYIIAQQPYFYYGDLNDKIAFLSFLSSLDQEHILTPSTYEEMDAILNGQLPPTTPPPVGKNRVRRQMHDESNPYWNELPHTHADNQHVFDQTGPFEDTRVPLIQEEINEAHFTPDTPTEVPNVIYAGEREEELGAGVVLEGLNRNMAEEEDVENCTHTNQVTQSYMLLVNDENNCPIDHWPTIVRYVQLRLPQYKAVLLRAPLSSQMAVMLRERLPHLRDSLCLALTVLTHNSYILPLEDLSPAKVVESLESLAMPSLSSCEPPREADGFYPIQPSLTTMQLEFMSGDLELSSLLSRTSYVLVGLTGGIAVVALAISIFWGLNGSAFT